MIGVWADGAPPRARDAEGWARAVAATGVRRASLWMLRRSDSGPPLGWTPDAVVIATAALRAEGVEALWCVWPRATKPALRELRAELERVWAAGLRLGVAPAPVDLDLEGTRDASGWGPGGAALAGELLEAVGARDEDGLRARVNCVPPARGLRAQDLAVAQDPRVGALCLQTYSQWNPNKAWTHADYYRPGVIQRAGLRLGAQARAARSGRALDLHLGQIVIFQNHPAPHARGYEALDAALLVALEGVRAGAVSGVDLWSLRHLRGLGPQGVAWVAGWVDRLEAARAARMGGGVA